LTERASISNNETIGGILIEEEKKKKRGKKEKRNGSYTRTFLRVGGYYFGIH